MNCLSNPILITLIIIHLSMMYSLHLFSKEFVKKALYLFAKIGFCKLHQLLDFLYIFLNKLQLFS